MKNNSSPPEKSTIINRSFGYAVVIMFSFFVMQSCIKKEEFDFSKIAAFNYDPNLAVPLIHSNLTIRDILNDHDSTHLFIEDGTGFLSLVYKSTVFSQRADKFIFINDQTNTTNFFLPVGVIPSGGSVSVAQNITYTFTADNSERYDSVSIKSGNHNLSINWNLNHSARIDVSIPAAKKNGIMFTKSFDYTCIGGVPSSISKSFDLSGYTVKFAPGNQLAINFTITVFDDGNPDYPTYSVSMNENFQDIKYNFIFGYLGNRGFAINQDSLFTDIFNNNVSGSFHLENPKLRVFINNSFGLPINLNFNTLEAYSPIHPLVSIWGLPNPWSINSPNPSQVGQTLQTADSLDKNNSNLKDALNISPKWVTYKVNAEFNPSDPTNNQNFVLDSSRFSVDVEIELPLHGSAWDFTLQDTLDFSFGEDVSDAEWVKFRINTDNGFPIDAHVQLLFEDSDSLDAFGHYLKIDSLFTSFEQVIYAAPIGSDGRVTASNHKYVETTISKSRLAALEKADKIFIVAKIATINDGGTYPPVKIYSDYFIDVKVGVQVQGHFPVIINK